MQKRYAVEVLQAIQREGVSNKDALNDVKLRVARRYHLHPLPSNPDILAHAKNPSQALRQLLGRKPMRSLSGVAVVGVMVSPHPCPGECTYCPESQVGKATPKSYTGLEPTTQRALRVNFDPFLQVQERLSQLEATQHATDKLEVIVMGGTYLSQGTPYQDWFVKGLYEGVLGHRTQNLQNAQKEAETCLRRLVGLTFETRPDYCSEKDIRRMLKYGGTRVELGVQCPDDTVYERTLRGHSVKDVVDATARLKDAAFKVGYHLMPGQPGSSAVSDTRAFKKVFTVPDFQPDLVKIYPTLVIPNTPLYEEWKRGEYTPLSTEECVERIVKLKKHVPYWCRVMRVQRDIAAPFIAGGNSKGNLRQLVEKRMQEEGLHCRCIRCREAGLQAYATGRKLDTSNAQLFTETYDASGGAEHFISFETPERDALFGFCRLRFPHSPSQPEIDRDTALVRELRVFGRATPLGEHNKQAVQHKGLGARLMQEAEGIARGAGFSQSVVIAGVGVKEYYREKFGYQDCGPYVARPL